MTNQDDIIEKINQMFDIHKKDWSSEGRSVGNLDFELMREDVMKLIKEALSPTEGDSLSLTKQQLREDNKKMKKQISDLEEEIEKLKKET